MRDDMKGELGQSYGFKYINMDEPSARKILEDMSVAYVDIQHEDCVTLDGDFSLEQMRAIVWWMEHKPDEKLPGTEDEQT